MFRVNAATHPNARAKVLFAAKYQHPDGFHKIASAIGYMAPPLRQAGFDLVVSDTLIVNIFTPGLAELLNRSYMVPRMILDRDAFVSETIEHLQKDISSEHPQFLAFPVLDDNAQDVFKIATTLAAANPTLAFVFGGPFITINNQAARFNFGSLSDVILINGEAELVFPLAMDAYLSGKEILASGVFCKKQGNVVMDTFDQRVCVSADEFAKLEFDLDVQLDELDFTSSTVNKPGIDIYTSKGCFRHCSYCAASSMLRKQFVSLSAQDILDRVQKAWDWAKKARKVSQLTVGLADDDRLRNPEIALEFFKLFKASGLSRFVRIDMQGAISGLLNTDGSINQELIDTMAGSLEVINLGIDMWEEEGRLRNRGGRERSLTNQQIRLIVKELAARKIKIKFYWLLGDEQATLTEFIKSALFLSELYIDYSPYVFFDVVNPISPYSGTPLLERLLGDPEAKKFLKVRNSLGQPGQPGYFPIYDIIIPAAKIINKMYDACLQITKNISTHFSPPRIMVLFRGFVVDWLQRLSPPQRQIFRQIFDLVSKGMDIKAACAAVPNAGFLPTSYRWLEDEPRQYEIAELLEAVCLLSQVPNYYQTFEALATEQSKRNPTLALLHQGIIDGNGKRIRIRPNDPCPCRSGKKYKKCCGAK